MFSSVIGDFGAEFEKKIKYIIMLEAPPEVRYQRIKERSFEKFLTRIEPSGNLYDNENKFFEKVIKRTEGYVTHWVDTMKGRVVIRIDGTSEIEENIKIVVE